ncbi:hypothetical protein [Kribbella sp. CA-293567]|uniref:hypothetical protein n=1 Tax=Kribbella sp. CA-293567 TaxID=3002436 RepID=UPI0022DDAD42|nr:hypothetical protein [Kribbella sp. CA-293567]WBQ03002.1 hypothetical protein OX958_23830 [Kribbella sp. CA-293567]
MRTLAGLLRLGRVERTTLQAFADAADKPATFLPSINDRDLGRADALTEAMDVLRRLGLEPRGPLEIGDLVRFVYAQGWQACESVLASADTADAIDDALNHPSHVTDKTSDDSINTWTVRALQQTVVRMAGRR